MVKFLRAYKIFLRHQVCSLWLASGCNAVLIQAGTLKSSPTDFITHLELMLAGVVHVAS